MAEYRLHCMKESGNANKVAMMLALTGADWEPVWVDYFNGATRTDSFKGAINEMGEVPVLDHGATRLTQSGVILNYLVEQTGKFGGRNARYLGARAGLRGVNSSQRGGAPMSRILWFTLGAIAGTAYASRVINQERLDLAVGETRLPGLADHAVIDASHSGLLFSAVAAEQAGTFLRDGRFRHD